ncbi:DUF5131 family protein [Clostridium thailandense]|uniref:DUF5131 family protein n=1 Tax=Clostridium thailandense TaxID=2794346 RepID=UPI0035E40960
MAMWNPWRGCKKCSDGCQYCYIHKSDYKLSIFKDLPIKHKCITAQPLLEKINIEKYLKDIELVIVGGESDNNARILDYDWVLDIRNQCVKANEIQIEYEVFGKKTNPTIVLIAGNGAQLNFWEPDFCEMLAKENLQVIRFDNRDVGLSTKFDEAGIPDMGKIYQAVQEGKAIKTPYTLEDMADDVAGLLDVLDIKKAHICGASMGGTIAQVFFSIHKVSD